jgi:dolichol-phosphate mannosyltransferase
MQAVALERWFQLGRFVLVGGSGVLVNSLTLFVLYGMAGMPFIVASAVSVELAITNNFVWNDIWTFARCGGSGLVRFARFNLVSLMGLVVTTSTAWLLVHVVGVHYLIANLVGISLASICNFVASVRWTWRT